MHTEPRDELVTALVRGRGEALVRFAYLLTGDVAAAQDLVQDALVKVFVRLRTRPDPALAEAYVRRAVVNLYIDDLRRRRNLGRLQHLLATPESQPPRDVAADLDLQAALATLAPRERAAVVLRYFDDLTVPEVADEMGLATGTVKRYLHDSVAKLERRLGSLPSLAEDVEALPVTAPGTAPRTGRRA